MAYRRFTYSGPYLVPHFMHRIWRCGAVEVVVLMLVRGKA